MASATESRNQRAKKIVLDWVARTRPKVLSAEEARKFTTELELLNQLIPISAMGFRGVVLTGIVGMQLDSNFDPLSNFYDCNPRSIFEHAIYYALQESGIPCGKSDPLNVAKNIQKLDYDWARGRRPEFAARAAVDYLKLLNKAKNDPSRYATLVRLYFRKLIDYAEYIHTQTAPLVEHEGEPPIVNALRLASFVVECPEGGTIPQFVVGNLVELLRHKDSRFKRVPGVGESVFGTNTTSKKPADVWEVMANDTIAALYEITVKVIDFKRLDDCVENLRVLGLTDKVVTFICRIPQDISSLGTTNDSLTFKGVAFQFLAIEAFIINSFCSLPECDQAILMGRVGIFVADVNRPLKTKHYWKDHFAV